MSVPAGIIAGTLVVWHAYKGAEEAALKAAAQAWGAEHGVETSVVPVPWGAFDSKVETAIPRGNGPDLFVSGHANVGKWSATGLLRPVELPPDVPELTAGTLDALTVDATLWGVPLAYKSPVLLYDPAQVSSPPKTTDELLAMARERSGDGRYGLAYEASTAYYHSAWMHGFGATLYGEDGEPHLDAPEHAAALAFARQVQEEGLLPLNPTAERIGQLYEEGKAAFVVSGPWFVADRTRPIRAAVLPVVSETGLPARPYLTVEAAFLAAQSDDPEAASAFAWWLATGPGATLRADQGGQTVTLASVTYEDELRQVLAEQAKVAVPMPTNADVFNVFESQQRALRRVLRGAATPEAAAAESQAWYEALTRGVPEPSSPWPFVGIFSVLGVGLVAGAGRSLADEGLRRRLRAHASDYLWILPAGIAVTVLVVLPFVTGATVSLYAHHHGTWTFVGLRNFLDILLVRDWPLWSPMSFFYTLLVTVGWTVANLVLHVGLGVLLALALREPWIRLRPMWRAALILPWAVPNYITALIWRTMFDAQYGAVNALLGLLSGQDGPARIDWFASFSTAFAANLATNTWLGFPFMMVVTLGALQSIPRELEEAAEVDGAGYWTRLRHVIWPMLKPALLPAVILGSVWTFNMFNVVYLVSKGEPDGATEILISQAYRWAFSRGNLYGYAAAYAVIIFFVLLGYSRSINRLMGRKVL